MIQDPDLTSPIECDEIFQGEIQNWILSVPGLPFVLKQQARYIASARIRWLARAEGGTEVKLGFKVVTFCYVF